MANENVTVYQLSKKNLCVSFSKNALASLKDGGSLALKVKVGSKEMTMLFLRDSVFQARMNEFRQAGGFKEGEKVSLFQRAKSWLKKPIAPKAVVTARGTANRPVVNTNGG